MKLFHRKKSLEVAEKTWFQRFGLFFYDKRETNSLLWVGLIIFGILSYTVLLPRQGFPEVNVPISVVSGTYFANDKAVVDKDVAKPASEAITKISEVKTVTASSGANFFNLIVEYKGGTSSAAGSKLVEGALSNNHVLPTSATVEYKPISAAKFAGEGDLLVAVTPIDRNRVDLQILEQKAQTVATRLGTVEGVASAKALRLYDTGIDPKTGQPATEQRSFDRIAYKIDGKIEGYPAVTVAVVAKSNTDAIHLYQNVQKAVDSNSLSPGSDVRVAVSADFAEGIKDQISGLQESLLQGLVAVLVICFLLISWRASLVTAIAMTAVILIAVGVLYLTGNTLNTITLFALILSLGLIVDDTIIMTEALDAGKRESNSKREIVSTAMRRVARASTTGTLTTILAFAPMIFISGILGSFIRILPITIIISLLVSLLVSLLLVPLLGRFLILTNKSRKAESRNPILKVERFVSNGLASILRVGKRSRGKGVLIGLVALLIPGVMIMASGQFFQKLKFDIFPATKDSDSIGVTMKFAPDTTIDQSQAAAEQADQIIIRTLGQNLKRLSYQNSGSATGATVQAELVSYRDRKPTSPQLIAQLQTAFTGFNGATIKVGQNDAGPPKDDLPFKMQIYGEDRAKAQPLAQALVNFLKNRDLKRPNGKTVRIIRAELANPTFVTRKNSQAIVEVSAGFDETDTSALVTLAQKAVEDEFTQTKLQTFGFSKDDIKFDFGNESDNQESFKAMLVAFPVLLVVMYLLMLIQFRSFLQPLLIFAAIPYSFFGVAAGLYFTNNPLSFFVMIGFFALIGIALNNTILLTDYANQARARGLGRIDAVAEAMKARFRPLVTTSLTSIVALTPLALTNPFWESLSVTLIFGLLSSTLLVVIAFPYLYLGGEVLRMFGHKLWSSRFGFRRKRPTAK